MIGFADRLRLHIPTGATTNHRIDVDQGHRSSDAMTIASGRLSGFAKLPSCKAAICSVHNTSYLQHHLIPDRPYGNSEPKRRCATVAAMRKKWRHFPLSYILLAGRNVATLHEGFKNFSIASTLLSEGAMTAFQAL
jgi:hypothetical protein